MGTAEVLATPPAFVYAGQRHGFLLKQREAESWESKLLDDLTKGFFPAYA